MVRADSGIKRIEDLKGKIVATNAIGGAVDIASKAMLLKHGLQDKRDYQVVELEFPNMLSAIEEKKIDLASMIMPFSIEAHKQGDLKTLFTVGQAMGEAQTTLLAARGAVHRRASRRSGRFLRGLDPRAALVLRSQEPRRGDRDHRRFHQEAAERLFRLALHQEGLLSATSTPCRT